MSDQSDAMIKTDKKTDVLEVRVPHGTKKAFMDACKEKGDTASGALRRAIDAYLTPRFALRQRPALFVALAAISIIAVAASYVAMESRMQVRELHKAHKLALEVKRSFERAVDGQFEIGGINPLAHMYFIKTDRDRDDRVTLDEFVFGILDRGSASRNEMGEGNTILRADGAALVLPNSDADALEAHGLKLGCFNSLKEIGQGEQSREFYALDTDKDSLLTLSELALSNRIPRLYELLHDFISKDIDRDGQLSLSETQEDVDAWRQNHATENNLSTRTIVGEVPGACKNPEKKEHDGRLLIKFEMLKRFVVGEFPDGSIGPTPGHFEKLDMDASGELNFVEFVAWYNRGIADFIGH